MFPIKYSKNLFNFLCINQDSLQLIREQGGLSKVSKLLLTRWRKLAEENIQNPHTAGIHILIHLFFEKCKFQNQKL